MMLNSASNQTIRESVFVFVILLTLFSCARCCQQFPVWGSVRERPVAISLYSDPKMIRRGKVEGWLQLPINALLPWAVLNDVTFDRIIPGFAAGRGGALLAKGDLDADKNISNVLLTVPRDLILSLERVQEHAKVDKDFREVLESLGDFGRVRFARRCLCDFQSLEFHYRKQIDPSGGFRLTQRRLADFWSDTPGSNTFVFVSPSLRLLS